MQGILEWYFGPQVRLSYRYQAGPAPGETPVVLVNGTRLATSINVDQIVRHLESLGLRRLDQQ